MATSVTVETYSEKAIVVRGALEHHGPVLSSIGGTFNERLKGGRGWIFPKYLLSQVRGVVEKLNSGQYGNEFEQKNQPTPSSGGTGAVEMVSKQEYLSLLSRVEKLEALVAQFTLPPLQPVSGIMRSPEVSPPKEAAKPSTASAAIDLDFEPEDFEDEEERKPLTRVAKPVRVVTEAKKSFSKPTKKES
jgi:hypothetical protein